MRKICFPTSLYSLGFAYTVNQGNTVYFCLLELEDSMHISQINSNWNPHMHTLTHTKDRMLRTAQSSKSESTTRRSVCWPEVEDALSLDGTPTEQLKTDPGSLNTVSLPSCISLAGHVSSDLHNKALVRIVTEWIKEWWTQFPIYLKIWNTSQHLAWSLSSKVILAMTREWKMFRGKEKEMKFLQFLLHSNLA